MLLKLNFETIKASNSKPPLETESETIIVKKQYCMFGNEKYFFYYYANRRILSSFVYLFFLQHNCSCLTYKTMTYFVLFFLGIDEEIRNLVYNKNLQQTIVFWCGDDSEATMSSCLSNGYDVDAIDELKQFLKASVPVQNQHVIKVRVRV